jgi:GNAT superfamily N-acetyltransferase
MRRSLGDGLELDDDAARVDVDAVHRYLSEESYWATGRSRETVEKLVREATRVVALYDGEDTVGFCRVVSDDATFAFLCDVYVLEPYRGRGLGRELIREAVDLGPQRDLSWHLRTRTPALYAPLGFGAADERQMFRRGTRPL